MSEQSEVRRVDVPETQEEVQAETVSYKKRWESLGTVNQIALAVCVIGIGAFILSVVPAWVYITIVFMAAIFLIASSYEKKKLESEEVESEEVGEAEPSPSSSPAPRSGWKMRKFWTTLFSPLVHKMKESKKKESKGFSSFVEKNWRKGLGALLLVLIVYFSWGFLSVALAPVADGFNMFWSYIKDYPSMLALFIIGCLALGYQVFLADIFPVRPKILATLVVVPTLFVVIPLIPQAIEKLGYDSVETEQASMLASGSTIEQQQKQEPDVAIESSQIAAAPEPSPFSKWDWQNESASVLDAIFDDSDAGLLSFWSYQNNVIGIQAPINQADYKVLRLKYLNRNGQPTDFESIREMQKNFIWPKGQNPYGVEFFMDGSVDLSKSPHRLYFEEYLNSLKGN